MDAQVEAPVIGTLGTMEEAGVRIPNGLTFAVNTSILFTELPLCNRPAAAAASGFAAIESWWPFSEPIPREREVDAFVRAVQDAGVQLTGLNFYAGDMLGGERGVVSVPGREREFRDSVAVLVSIAERTGCRAFNALYGQRVDGVAQQQQDDLAAENLAFAAQAVSHLRGIVLVEPLASNENGAYPLLTAADVLTVVDRVMRTGSDNVRLLADVYHLARNGDDPIGVVRSHSSRIGHVQIADAPGRHEPGTGVLDFAGIFMALAASGYSGYVGLEYRPSGASVDSFNWLPVRYRSRRRAHNPDGGSW